jgi:cell division protein FtsZ
MIEIPNIPLEEFEVPKEGLGSTLGIKNEYVGSHDFGVIGSGQCGGRIAKSFYDIGYKKTIALNTAMADLNPLDLPDVQKVRIGSLEGSGKNMNKGKTAAEESAQTIFDKMKAVFGAVDKIIICVGFGGGTGAGSCPVLISLARKYLTFIGNIDPVKNVIIVAALPTQGELRSEVTKANNEKIKNTMFQLAEQGEVGPIILIDNSKIEKLYRGIPPTKFWSTINDTITQLFQIFNFLSKQESEYTSFDSEDYRAVLTTSGLAVLGVSKVELKDGTELGQALQNSLRKTLLSDVNDFGSAKEAACIVVAGDEVMKTASMDTINYGFDAVSNLIQEANVHRGLYATQGNAIRAYILITGMKG